MNWKIKFIIIVVLLLTMQPAQPMSPVGQPAAQDNKSCFTHMLVAAALGAQLTFYGIKWYNYRTKSQQEIDSSINSPTDSDGSSSDDFDWSAHAAAVRSLDQGTPDRFSSKRFTFLNP